MAAAATRKQRIWTLMAFVLLLAASLLGLLLTRVDGTALAATGSTGRASGANPALTETPCATNPGFEQVASPNANTRYNSLNAAAAVAPNDIWAVGFSSGNGPDAALIQHWNGTAWSIVPAPSTGANDYSYLRGITAISANDIWAVGYYLDYDLFNYQALTLHWNGTAWTIVPVEGYTNLDPRLYAVTSTGPNDVWAVGYLWYSPNCSFALHWNGTAWVEDPSARTCGPEGLYYAYFSGVTAISPSDVWAVGVAWGNNGQETLTSHYNGTAWTRVASPNPSTSGDSVLRAVTATGPNDVWAVGYYYHDGINGNRTLIIHWNGTQWVIVPSPDPNITGESTYANPVLPPARPQKRGASPSNPDGSGGGDECQGNICIGNFLYGITAISPTEIYAVGSTDIDHVDPYTLALRWDGTQWTVVPSSSPSTSYNRLFAVTNTGPAGAVWAVGSYYVTTFVADTLIERYDPRACPTPTPIVGTATPTPCTGAPPEWTAVDSPNGDLQDNRLMAVGVVSANDIWALGQVYSFNGNITLYAHWDGTSWTRVRGPSINTEGLVEDVDVIAANDIWAVGEGVYSPLMLHYDGTQWTRFASPVYGNAMALYSVSAVSTNDVWAVGQREYEGGPLIMHYNGIQWSLTNINMAQGAPASHGMTTHLESVTAIAANDVWAVGTFRFSDSNRTLIMHYDGSQWNLVTSPSPGTYTNQLTGVSASGPNDVWAVGYDRNFYEESNRTLILHYNGTQWSIVPSPNPRSAAAGTNTGPKAPDYDYDGNILNDVVAVSPDEAWAVGVYGEPPYGTTNGQSLVLRWDGTGWAQVPGANSSQRNELSKMAAVAPGYLWAVGNQGTGASTYTLIERYGPACGNVTASPTTTGTPPTATATATAVCNPNYVYAQATAPIVPGTVDIGLNCDFCNVDVNLPFAYSLYGQSYTAMSVNAKGSLQFVSTNPGWTASCMPNVNYDTAIFGLYYDIMTRGNNVGVYTSVSGTSPNRIFNVEWRACTYSASPCTAADTNFELRLYENASRFDVIYGQLQDYSSHYATVGVQEGNGLNGNRFTQYRCGTGGGFIPSGTILSFTLPPCSSPTITPTPCSTCPTSTNIPTRTPTFTRTPTPTRTVTSTGTITPTPPPTSTAQPTACIGSYAVATGTATIIPGTVDTGNHCDDCTTFVNLPFPFVYYNTTYLAAYVASNGLLDITTSRLGFDNECLPSPGLEAAIIPHWDDLDTRRTAACSNCGVYTSVSGAAPNRVFNIEWRTTYFNAGGRANFEARLYEGTGQIDFVYGQVDGSGTGATAGIQSRQGPYLQYECNIGGLTQGRLVTFTFQSCASPTLTPTPCTGCPTSTTTATVAVPPTQTATQQATPGGPTDTPTAVATACPLLFTDVHSTDYFFGPVRYLFCMGAVSGYSDSTFRPFNNTTRGQLAKMVVLSMGWTQVANSGRPHFSDVQPDNPFYSFVETAYRKGTLSGYADGTFRPNNNVTRGQLSKIAVMAEGWPVDAPLREHFSDVPHSDPFFAYVETAYARNIISGYADGTFRAGNSATRAQIAKILFTSLMVAGAER